MSSEGGYTAAPPPRQGGDRFYNPPAARRHQQILLQQQQHQMLQRQLLQQQQQQQHQQQQRQQHQQRLLQRRAALMPESSAVAAGTEKRNDGDVSSTAVALSVPPSAGRGSTLNVTNLDRLMESVTPCIQGRYLSEVNARGRRAREVDSLPFFHMEDLWEFFSEWSYYGAGVPLVLNGKVPIEQYYVPYLSGIQLFIDPSSQNGGPIDAETYRLSKLSLGDESVSEVDKSRASFQYFEFEQPFLRRPLADKLSIIASENPALSKIKSCDLLPTSWICVAWYPIYRIPVGPTLQDLDASFLTFHSLSTQPKGNSPPRFHAPNTRTVRGIADPTPKVSLPVFALASYKLKGSIVSPCGPHECEQENSLLEAVDTWLSHLKVTLPDFQFFRNHSQRR
ncbi:hypothetical protein PHJA_002391200 [Phtheirospermum japonicum]|uniref:Uncharacterized protein n=1 Tax=Phtheirospermum japonicum TaxID=374723 RepID=A0A830CW11_9LAMI|nr:hypothetical protein PHJA_002391200 [Phtheirospermum japonicum]